MTTVSRESFSSISYVYDGEENGDVYETGVNMMQVLLLHSTLKSTDIARKPSLACMRVRSDRLEVVEDQDGSSNGDGGGDGEQGDGDNAGHRGGVDWRVMLGALGWATVMRFTL